MRLNQKEYMGLYYPTHYLLIGNFNKTDLESEENHNIELSKTMLHETIHFLQDFSLYGLINCISRYAVLNEYIKYYQQQNILEYISIKELNVNISAQDDVQRTISGDYNKEKSLHKDQINGLGIRKVPYNRDYFNYSCDEIDDEIILIENYGIQIIEVFDKKDDKEVFSFQAIDVMESMANLIETLVYPDKNDTSKVLHIPYNSAEIITEIVYPEIGNAKENIVALCIQSLFTMNPPYYFYEALCTMKDACFLPSSPLDILTFFKTQKCEDGSTYLDQYRIYSDKYSAFIKNYLYKPLADTLLTCLSRFNSRIIENLNFLIDGLLNKTHEEKVDYYVGLGREISMPLYLFNDYVGGSKEMIDDLHAQPSMYYVYYYISNLLICNNKDRCKFRGRTSNGISICKYESDCCDDRPWENDFCIISLIWKSWSLPKIVNI